MVAKTFSATHHGVDGRVVEVEAARESALPQIQITGLPGSIVKESRERVRVSLGGLGFSIPTSRIVVHLLPADAPKQGSQFDLAIAVGVLAAESFAFERDISKTAFIGELTLDGRIKEVYGALALVEALDRLENIERILLPAANGWEGMLSYSRKVRLAERLGEVIGFLKGKCELPCSPQRESVGMETVFDVSLDQVLGQTIAKRSLQIAIAGRHHLLMIGTPGVGKSMLAQCVPSLLPPLTRKERIEVVKNYAHLEDGRLLTERRPFRSPHHTISPAALLGGGSGRVIPGEVTLAHRGVLFLDEFPEFRKDMIEGLREPIQNGTINLHRVGQALSLPARFTLIAAMNPCPCGYAMSQLKRCRCSPDRILSYRKRISGAILDRMDLCAVVNPPSVGELKQNGMSQAGTKGQIEKALGAQCRRYQSEGMTVLNGDLSGAFCEEAFALDAEEKSWLEGLYERQGLSVRSLQKIVKLARTISDLDGEERISPQSLKEAWSLRCPDSYAQLFGY